MHASVLAQLCKSQQGQLPQSSSAQAFTGYCCSRQKLQPMTINGRFNELPWGLEEWRTTLREVSKRPARHADSHTKASAP